MAGMLPGVECARRRRFHQGSADPHDRTCTRRFSFGFFPSHYEARLNSQTVNCTNQSRTQITGDLSSWESDKLGDAAKEARQRLKERLRSSRSERHNSMATGKLDNHLLININGSTDWKFRWLKKGWRSTDQYQCPICLEGLKEDQLQTQLQCTHQFHSRCISPWLQVNAHCPYCRSQIPPSM